MLRIDFLPPSQCRGLPYGAFLAGWYWSGCDLDGMEYRDVGPFLSRANAISDAADCGVRSGFRSTAARVFAPLPFDPIYLGS